jgi:hypothetical protein
METPEAACVPQTKGLGSSGALMEHFHVGACGTETRPRDPSASRRSQRVSPLETLNASTGIGVRTRPKRRDSPEMHGSRVALCPAAKSQSGTRRVSNGDTKSKRRRLAMRHYRIGVRFGQSGQIHMRDESRSLAPCGVVSFRRQAPYSPQASIQVKCVSNGDTCSPSQAKRAQAHTPSGRHIDIGQKSLHWRHATLLMSRAHKQFDRSIIEVTALTPRSQMCARTTAKQPWAKISMAAISVSSGDTQRSSRSVPQNCQKDVKCARPRRSANWLACGCGQEVSPMETPKGRTALAGLATMASNTIRR